MCGVSDTYGEMRNEHSPSNQDRLGEEDAQEVEASSVDRTVLYKECEIYMV
jgi:hypothetical protein